MDEFAIVDGIDPRSLIEPDEVYVPWAEAAHLAHEVVLKLMPIVEKFGPFDTIVAIKHGGTSSASLIERVIPHGVVRYARLKRAETKLTERDSPSPTIVYFPDEADIADKRVLGWDEVWESGKSGIRVIQELERLGARSIEFATLHFKPECNHFGRTPTVYGAEIDRKYRCYPWELWERMAKARLDRAKVLLTKA